MKSTLLSCTCFTGHAEAGITQWFENLTGFHHVFHALMYQVPCVIGNIRKFGREFWIICFYDLSVYCFDFSKKRQIIECSFVCNGRHIFCKLTDSIVIGTLSKRRTNRVFRRYLRCGFRYFQTGLLIQPKHFCIFFQNTQALIVGKFTAGILTHCIGHFTEEYVAGMLDRSDNI